MTAPTLDSIRAGLLPAQDITKAAFTAQAAGQLHSFWYLAGNPGGAASAPTPGLAGAALSNPVTGQIPFSNPASGKTYLANLWWNPPIAESISFMDRIWHNSGIVSATTTAQTVNSVTFSARDDNDSANGQGFMMALECSTATTNGAAIANTTVTYTNSAGGGSRTATLDGLGTGWPANAVAGTFVPFSLQAGDQGVQSIQSITLGTSYGTGVVHLVVFRYLAGPYASGVAPTRYDALSLGCPEFKNDCVPWLVLTPSSTGQLAHASSFQFSQPG